MSDGKSDTSTKRTLKNLRFQHKVAQRYTFATRFTSMFSWHSIFFTRILDFSEDRLACSSAVSKTVISGENIFKRPHPQYFEKSSYSHALWTFTSFHLSTKAADGRQPEYRLWGALSPMQQRCLRFLGSGPHSIHDLVSPARIGMVYDIVVACE